MMKLLAFLMQTGGHVAGWRHERAAPNALCDVDYFCELARIAERGCFDSVFLADYLGFNPVDGAEIFSSMETPKLDPITLLSAMSTATKNVGLIGTASTTYNEPYDIARRFASLDHVSKGRAGWNIVTSTMENEAHNYGKQQHMEHSLRYERAAESIDVVTRLWDSWADGAVRADKASGQYTDPAKIRGLDFKGAHFSVEGPLTVPRPPQGHPVLVQAGASPAGKAFAASCAEVIFTSNPTKEQAIRFRAEMHGLLAQNGRDTGSLKILTAITPVVGATAQDALAQKAHLDGLIPDKVAISKLQAYMGRFDLSPYSPDEQLPELPADIMAEPNSTRERVIEVARTQQLSIRQLAQQVAGGRTSVTLAGTAGDIADTMGDWFDSGACDGFIVVPPFLPGSLEDFVDGVVPILQQRGQFRKSYEGSTLRENLGLARPANRFEEDPSLAATPKIF